MAVIEINDIGKFYKKVKAVDGISFSVEQGEIFGLLGPNGAGKTTTIECIEGLRQRDTGSISVLGMDPQRQGKELRKQIGLQLQESALPQDIKVWEAMDLYASFYDTSIDWRPLLVQLGMEEKKDSRFSKLSGGQKQRLYIALALVNDPSVVFFDELTTGLDPQSRRTMWDLVRGIRENGKTVFLTTHFMDEAEILCDRIVIIDEGHIVAEGSPEELIRNLSQEFRILFVSQGPLDEHLVEKLPSVSGIKKNGDRYVVTGRGEMLIKEVIDVLVDNGIRFKDLRTEHPNLEDVFLSLTGRSIRE